MEHNIPAEEVIRRLSAQVADLSVQLAMKDTVIQQLETELLARELADVRSDQEQPA